MANSWNNQIVWVTGASSGFGLFNIRERLQLMGAGLEIDSGSETGTEVTVTAPMAAMEPDSP